MGQKITERCLQAQGNPMLMQFHQDSVFLWLELVLFTGRSILLELSASSLLPNYVIPVILAKGIALSLMINSQV